MAVLTRGCDSSPLLNLRVVTEPESSTGTSPSRQPRELPRSVPARSGRWWGQRDGGDTAGQGHSGDQPSPSTLRGARVKRADPGEAAPFSAKAFSQHFALSSVPQKLQEQPCSEEGSNNELLLWDSVLHSKMQGVGTGSGGGGALGDVDGKPGSLSGPLLPALLPLLLPALPHRPCWQLAAGSC